MFRPLTFLRTLRDERRQLGWSGLLRKRGWTLVLVFVCVYIIRDTLLYILVPLALAAGLFRH
ncbi:MAG TPA: hypothetical protein VMH88_15245 [Gemmatimonadales bacterium]|nr:hypothetical protein [Gemmatimonadales bacterium]